MLFFLKMNRGLRRDMNTMKVLRFASLFVCVMFHNCLLATWTVPTTLCSDSTGEAPQVAINSSSNGIAVWQCLQGDRTSIKYTTFSGGSWSSELLVSEGGIPETPRVVIDDSGTAVAIWRSTTGSNTYVKTSTYSGGSWSFSAILSAIDKTVENLDLTMNASGKAVATWVLNDGGTKTIQAAVFSGGSWEAISTLSGSTAGIYPSVAINSVGTALLAWVIEGTYEVKASILTGSTWSSPTVLGIGTFATNIPNIPDVAINTSGLSFVVWSDLATKSMLVAKRESGSWSAAQTLGSVTFGFLREPKIAINDSGVAIALWECATGGLRYIQATRFFADTWSAPEIISQRIGVSYNAHLTLDALGNAAAVWNGMVSFFCIQGATFTGGSWSGPGNISDITKNADSSTVTGNSSGKIIALYRIIENNGFVAQATENQLP